MFDNIVINLCLKENIMNEVKISFQKEMVVLSYNGNNTGIAYEDYYGDHSEELRFIEAVRLETHKLIDLAFENHKRCNINDL
jgi:hypothetical protein